MFSGGWDGEREGEQKTRKNFGLNIIFYLSIMKLTSCSHSSTFVTGL